MRGQQGSCAITAGATDACFGRRLGARVRPWWGDGQGGVGDPDPAGSRFVGRERELGRLEEGLAGAAAGRAAAFAIGRGRVGTSRLLQEFLVARSSGATSLVGRCVDVAEGVLPFWSFVDALCHYAGSRDTDAREALFGFTGAELDRLIPELSGGSELAVPPAGPSAHGHLFELLLGLVQRLAATSPLVESRRACAFGAGADRRDRRSWAIGGARCSLASANS